MISFSFMELYPPFYTKHLFAKDYSQNYRNSQYTTYYQILPKFGMWGRPLPTLALAYHSAGELSRRTSDVFPIISDGAAITSDVFFVKYDNSQNIYD